MKTYSDVIFEAILSPEEIERMRKLYEECIEHYYFASERDPFPYDPWNEMGWAEDELTKIGVFDKIDMQSNEKEEFIEHLRYYFI